VARTKRKVNYVQPEIVELPASQGRVYRTGGYVRLSVEDSGKPGADTIYAQKELVQKYIEGQSDMTYCGMYCDNGRTGTITCEKKARKSREDMIEYGVWNIST